MSAQVEFAFNFRTIECYKCHIVFAVYATTDNRWREKGETFYCPAGHSQSYCDSENTLLKKQLEQKQRALEQERKYKEWAQVEADNARKSAKRQAHRANAFKGVITKTKRRIGNGVCPCCNRSFQNLMSHMKVQHPKYKDTK